MVGTELADRAGSPRDGGEGRRGRPLAFNSGAVFAITVVVQLVGFVPTFFLARGLGSTLGGQALFGLIQTFMLLASSVSSLGDLRIGSAYTFFVSRGDSPKRATATYLVIRLAMVSAAGSALWLLSPSLQLSSSATFEIVAVWMVLPLLWSASTVYINLWTSLGDSARGQYPGLLESIVRAAALTYVAIVLLDPASLHGAGNPSLTLWSMTGAYLVAAVASAAFSIPTLWRFRGRPSRAEGARLIRWSWPLMGSMTLLFLSGNLINFVVIAFLHAGAFNRFNAVNAFRTLALALPSAIAVPLFPHISALHKEEAFAVIRARSWQALRYTAMLVVPGVVALVIYRVNVLNILYQGLYVPANGALAILAISAIPAALSQIIGTTLTAIGKTRLELYITSLQVACLAAVAFTLVEPPEALTSLEPLGLTALNGAALAVLISSLAGLLLNTYFLYALVGVRVQLRSLTAIVGSAAASFFAISRLNAYLLHVSRYYELLAGVTLGFAVYLAALSLSGELTRQDLRLVCESLGLPDRVGRFLGRFCWKEEAPAVNPLPARGAAALVPLDAKWDRAESEPSPAETGPWPPGSP